MLLGKLKKDNTEEWRLADNTYRAFTYEKLSEVPEIYSDRERNAFKKFHKLDDKLNLKDGDILTFIRLTMLAGRMW